MPDTHAHLTLKIGLVGLLERGGWPVRTMSYDIKEGAPTATLMQSINGKYLQVELKGIVFGGDVPILLAFAIRKFEYGSQLHLAVSLLPTWAQGQIDYETFLQSLRANR